MQIQKRSPENYLLKPSDSPTERNRLTHYLAYCENLQENHFLADLGEYRDYLVSSGYSSASISSILGTIRSRLRTTLKNNKFIADLRASFLESGIAYEDAELRLQALLRAIENNADAVNSRVSITKIQDYTDDQKLRINGYEDIFIRNAGLGKSSLLALRDQAIVAMFLATGIRREELTNLLVEDIQQTFQGEPALLVRKGKGSKQRVVIYGDLYAEYIEPYVNAWVSASGATGSQYLFRAFWRGYTKLRDTKIDVSTINDIIGSVPFSVDGKTINVHPHALRRTYARRLFTEFKMPILAIKQQMGHDSEETTQAYIGVLDIEDRSPKRRKE